MQLIKRKDVNHSDEDLERFHNPSDYARSRCLVKCPSQATSGTDISRINSQAQERLGYPTQKPEALLERIIKASSNEGDLVLDPFCGCGTTVQVAQRLNRRWIGIDITHLAIGLIKKRSPTPSARRSKTPTK